MIRDDEVQIALDYLQNNANEDAQAKANREHMSDYVKVVLSEQTQKFLDAGLSFSAADCKAKTSQEYKNALVNKKQRLRKMYADTLCVRLVRLE